jgi:hypothetical protein
VYDFYPEWGPARNRDEHEPPAAVRRPRYWPASAMAGGPDARDADRQRPDDN